MIHLLNYVSYLPQIVSNTTENIFEGLDSEVKTRIPGRSGLVYRVKFYFAMICNNDLVS